MMGGADGAALEELLDVFYAGSGENPQECKHSTLLANEYSFINAKY